MPELAPVLGVVLAAVAAIVGYFFRGRIGGSTADKLWDVTEKLRQEQAQEIRDLKVENREHEKRIVELEKDSTICKALAEQLEKSNARLERENERKDDYVSRLLADNQNLIKENTTLKRLE